MKQIKWIIIKVSEFEASEKQRRDYANYKSAVAPYFEQLYKIEKMMSTDIWCDITITASAHSSSCHPCGNWFVYEKGKEMDKIELTISDDPEGSNKATIDWLIVIKKQIKDKIRRLALLYGFEEDSLD